MCYCSIMADGNTFGFVLDLSRSSGDELLDSARALIGSEREITARFVAHLAEIEERRLHLDAGFSSLFELCVAHFRLSEGEAYRRILAARLVQRFPPVYEHLASGAVNLSALELLREHLTEDNHAELLEAAIGKSKRQIQMLLATRFPKPDVAPSLQRLPDTLQPRSGDITPEGGAVRAQRGVIEPLAEARYRVEFTASAALRDKLELCRDLLSHANPSRDLAQVIERAVDLLLTDLERKRLASLKRSPSPARSNAVATNSARPHVPRGVRRQVFERDGRRCSFVSRDGRRCSATAFLELDHVEPRAHGGTHDPENMRVLCRAHNQRSAEQVFGRDYVDERRAERQRNASHLRQQKCDGSVSDGPIHGGSGDREPVGTEPVVRHRDSECQRVRAALKNLGFRDAETRAVIDALQRKFDGTGSPTAAELLREAVLLATARLPLRSREGCLVFHRSP